MVCVCCSQETTINEQEKPSPNSNTTKTESYSPLNLIYSASYFHDLDGEQGNILTVANIRKIADFEDSILKGEEYEKILPETKRDGVLRPAAKCYSVFEVCEDRSRTPGTCEAILNDPQRWAAY